MIKVNIKKKPIIIILSVITLAVIITLGLNSYKAKKIADMEDRMIQLTLKQTTIDLDLEQKSFPDNERLSDVENLNELLIPE